MAEKQRQDWLCGFQPRHVARRLGRPVGFDGSATKARLRREFEATTTRFGTDIDDLAPYVVAAPRVMSPRVRV